VAASSAAIPTIGKFDYLTTVLKLLSLGEKRKHSLLNLFLPVYLI
jgi:hypothetical protein